jgi:hypothetical protein
MNVNEIRGWKLIPLRIGGIFMWFIDAESGQGLDGRRKIE